MKFFNRFKKSKVQYVEPKMYILVRNDLIPGLQMAQACHAASYLSAQNPLKLYQHPTTICLQVPDEATLLRYSNYEGFLFREPDLDYQATAFAMWSEENLFQELSLALKQALIV